MRRTIVSGIRWELLGSIACMAFVCFSLSARAQTMSLLSVFDAPVSYSADFYIHAGAMKVEGFVHHAPGKEVREYDWRGIRYRLSFFADDAYVYLQVPSQGMSFALPFDGLGLFAGLTGDLRMLPVTLFLEGEETYDGLPVGRYKAVIASSTHAQIWRTSDGIAARIVTQIPSSPKSTQRVPVTMVLGNVVHGPQDEKIFDRPQGSMEISRQNLSMLGLLLQGHAR